ncbi:sodium-translocating pyrophosphatase [Candidatus Saccharibacteria bacterium]|nr:sodium-translocating pyrophosphatase [Candidatus Saccharibacteria bacterium]
MDIYVYGVTFIAIAAALFVVLKNYLSIKVKKNHTAKEEDEMLHLSQTIQKGAKVFMKTEYQTIIPVVVLIGLGFSLFIEASSGLTYILGACMSSAVVFIGMYGATYANYRVARRAFKSKSVGRTVWTALKGGSISGLSVQAFGMLGLTLIYVLQYVIFKNYTVGHGLIANLTCDANIMRCTTYSLGCSTVAMFNRVAGGNFTKSADISSDILNKLRHDLPEDDPRIPNVLADFIGDNVNDIAGNCSDLLESFVATLVASQLIANIVYKQNGVEYQAIYEMTCLFPIVVATIGLIGCTAGIVVAMMRKWSMGENPAGELNKVTYISASITIIGSLIASYFMFGNVALYPDFKAGWISPWIAALLGIISGVAVGKITEIYTSTDYHFVQDLAKVSPEGAAFLVTLGDALGFRSCLPPGIVIATSIVLSYISCGLYGIAIAALGMLSFVGATVSIDAFGPISDNAGGIAEGCHLGEEFRAITDKLDATGNTTAAIGKGFAIGSAAYATVSLIFAYVGNFTKGEIVLNMANPFAIAGGLVGAVLVAYFMALLTQNTIDAAVHMADAGDKQFTENPGILDGTVKPDYDSIIKMATKLALKKMLVPSILAIVIPVPCLLLGYEFVGGMLVGSTLVAIPMAIFMGNSGGAFDNAKKYVEEGLLEGYSKGSDAHKTTVIGDTVGDTRKDVVGVALDIFIKMMSTVANTLAPVFSSVHLF